MKVSARPHTLQRVGAGKTSPFGLFPVLVATGVPLPDCDLGSYTSTLSHVST